MLLRNILKNYPLSIICILGIWILSLIPVFPETGLEDVPFIDKWTHFVMYGVMVIILWLETPCQVLHKVRWIMIVGVSLMGGLLELLQAYCTGGRRSGDWFDFAADAVGAILGAIVCLILSKILHPKA